MAKAKMTNVGQDREVRTQVRTQRSRLEQLLEKHTAANARAVELRGELQGEGEAVSIAVAELLEDDEQVQRQRQLEQTEQELKEIDQAVAIQQRRLQEAEAAAASQVRDAALPEHQQLAEEIAKALRNLEKAMQAERDFRKSFHQRFGCSWSIGPMVSVEFEPLRVLRPDGGSRLIRDYLARLEQFNYPTAKNENQK